MPGENLGRGECHSKRLVRGRANNLSRFLPIRCRRGFSTAEAAVSLSIVIACLAMLLSQTHQDALQYAVVAERSDNYLKAFLASEKEAWSCSGVLASCESGLLLPLRSEGAQAQSGAGYCVNRIITTASGSVSIRRFCR